MKKLSIFALVALMVVGLSLSAAAVDWTALQFNTDLRVDSGRLDFDQYIYNSDVGSFTNRVDAQGEDIHFLNGASTGWMDTYYEDFDDDGLGTVTVDGHYYINFAQDVYLEDDGTCCTDFYSYQKFQDFGSNYIYQMINSPDFCNGEGELYDFWNDDLNSGQGIQGVFNDRYLPPGAGGRAVLIQKGYLETSDLFAKQAGNIPGVYGYNTVDLWNDYDPMEISLDQAVVWNGNWS